MGHPASWLRMQVLQGKIDIKALKERDQQEKEMREQLLNQRREQLQALAKQRQEEDGGKTLVNDLNALGETAKANLQVQTNLNKQIAAATTNENKTEIISDETQKPQAGLSGAQARLAEADRKLEEALAKVNAQRNDPEYKAAVEQLTKQGGGSTTLSDGTIVTVSYGRSTETESIEKVINKNIEEAFRIFK